MMTTKITLASVKKNHPKEFAEIMAKLRKGKSKHNKAIPSKLTWTIQSCVAIKPLTLGDILSGKKEPEKSYKNADEYFEAVKCNWGAQIQGSIGTWKCRSGMLKELPSELINEIKNIWINDKAEKERYSSLTEAEKEKEIEETYKKLGFDTSFLR